MQRMKRSAAKDGAGAGGSNILRGLAGTLVLVGFDECKKAYVNFMYPDANAGFDQ